MLCPTQYRPVVIWHQQWSEIQLSNYKHQSQPVEVPLSKQRLAQRWWTRRFITQRCQQIIGVHLSICLDLPPLPHPQQPVTSLSFYWSNEGRCPGQTSEDECCLCPVLVSGSQMGVRVHLGVLWSTAGGTQEVKVKRKWTSGSNVKLKTRRMENLWKRKHPETPKCAGEGGTFRGVLV